MSGPDTEVAVSDALGDVLARVATSALDGESVAIVRRIVLEVLAGAAPGVDATGEPGNVLAIRRFAAAHPDRPPSETWAITKGMTAPTGGQAWRYAAHPDPAPGTGVLAQVFDPRTETWLPISAGNRLIRLNGAHVVLVLDGRAAS